MKKKKRRYSKKKAEALAVELLDICNKALHEEDDKEDMESPNNPFQKYKVSSDEDDNGAEISTTDGNPPHYHPLKRDAGGKVIGHGKASEGPEHTHEIEGEMLKASKDGHTHSFNTDDQKGDE